MSYKNSIDDKIQCININTTSISSSHYNNSPISDNNVTFVANKTSYNANDRNVIFQPLPVYSNPFQVLSWNCDGYNYCDTNYAHLKHQSFDILFHDISPDILCFQEFRIHYFRNNGFFQDSHLFIPPTYIGYFSIYDPLLKNVIYIKSKYHSYTEDIIIPTRDTTIYDLANHHWAKWCIIHKHPNNSLPVSIVICSYWRSPSRSVTTSDIRNLLIDITYIQQRFKDEPFKLIINGDFNIHHPAISLPSETIYKSTDYTEYAALCELLSSYKLSIVNDRNKGTFHWKDRKTGKLKWSLLDIQIVSDSIINHGFHHQILQCEGSRHLPLLTVIPFNVSDIKNQHNASKSYQTIKPYHYRFNNPKDLEAYKAAAIAGCYDIKNHFEPLLTELNADYKTIIDDITFNINELLHRLGVTLIGTYNSNKNKYRKPWCNKKVIKISKHTNRVYLEWKTQRTDESYQKYKHWVKIRSKVCREAKKEYAIKLAFKCNIHDNDWWKIIKNIEQFEKGYSYHKYSDYIPFIYKTTNCNGSHLNQAIYDDYIKANEFNERFCYRSKNVDNPKKQHIDLKNIPSISPTIYPVNNLCKAERIKNPKLQSSKRYGTKQALYTLNDDISINEILFALFCNYLRLWMAQIEGLGEGRVISVILNYLYLDPICHVLIDPDKFKLVLYVDDIVLFSIFNRIYRNKENVVFWIQREIDEMVKWLKDNRMRFSVKKTKSITFISNHIRKYYPSTIFPVTLYLSPLEPIEHITDTTKSFKYLGYHLTVDLNVKYQINIIVKKVCVAFIAVKKMLKNIPNLLAINHYYLIQSSVLSIFEYYYGFLVHATYSELKPIIVLYHRILRYLSGTLKSVPLDILYWLSNSNSLEIKIKSYSAKWWMRNMSICDNNPLYYIIENQWFPRWKRYLFGYDGGKYKLKRYSKKSIFWKSFRNAIDYEMLNIYTIQTDSNYCDWPRDIKYIPLNISRPANVKYMKSKYTDYSDYNLNVENLFIFCDGSLQKFIAGIGISIEAHCIYPHQHHFVPIIKYQYQHYLGKMYDINLIELIGLKYAIHYVVKNKMDLNQYKRVYIICDNQQAINWLIGVNQIKSYNVYNLICKTYQLLNILHFYEYIYFIHCKRGKWSGNIRADKLAKKAIHQEIEPLYITLKHIVSKMLLKLKYVDYVN